MTSAFRHVLGAVLVTLLAACGTPARSPTESPSASAAPDQSLSPSEAAAIGSVEPAPGSDSAVYAPNPGAIVVAIDAGHGGCLDWGVPDPSERGVELAEKTLTLGIARRLRDRLETEGVTVVMVRDADVALAGDLYPDLGCNGPAWRDVNGDGEAGFDPEGAIRTRDELQARLDVANLAQADAFLSIHINSPFDGGQSIRVAFSETFYTDESPWGVDVTEPLARAVQGGVVAALGAVADYERGDRGVTAHNFYLVAPPLFEPTPERPDPIKQPTRGALMPTVLSEVGSITLREEHDLLASPEGQDAVAAGLFDGIATFLGERRHAVRIGLDDLAVGAVPDAAEGGGPPYLAWPAPVAGSWRLRVTNTGTEPIAEGSRLVAGWEATDAPYLYLPPSELAEIGEALPALAPGESVSVSVELPAPPRGSRALAWISLSTGTSTLAEHGSPALQLANDTP
ncbi:MAG TPA: N-acetylmuramoyl-L-alanine amidase [Candidatus Limnocylindria bacterium]|nr:N-acetylmuramoyl-L-alanine amidase [Candidatus Limnocylindria bacterium]